MLLLSYQTYKQFGLTFLLKEVKRYIVYGPAEIPKYEANHDINYSVKNYSNEELEKISSSIQIQPKISVVLPVLNTNITHLNACIQSVLSQKYPNFELCIYDDCSSENATIACLETWQDIDKRIKIIFGKTNKHISLATNKAIEMATGEYISFIDHDDEIAPIALLRIVETINKQPDADVIYSDEDFINPEGEYFRPHFKSDFNLPLLLSHNYITHLLTVRKTLGDKIGWLREGYEGAQDHDLLLRLAEETSHIVHIPEVLYHWRQSPTSTAYNYLSKPYANKATQKALLNYINRNNINASVEYGAGMGIYRIKRVVETKGLVSIIIPFKDEVKLLKECINSIKQKTEYENYEIILISNRSNKQETFDFLKQIENVPHIKVYEFNQPFNFSAINNWAVTRAKGKYILLLNNDTKIINRGWLKAMLEHIQQEDVGVVGAKLLYPDHTIQHGGVIIGIQGVAGHSHKHMPESQTGYFYRPNVIQELSAVTGACLLTKKALWEKVGGLDEKNLAIAFNDIDYCLNLRKEGYKIIYTPYAKLFHFESKSRGFEDTLKKQNRYNDEVQFMLKKWKTNEIPDPFYNVNLSLKTESFLLKEI